MGGGGGTQVNKRSAYTRPCRHMQQCSAVLKTLCVLHHITNCTLDRPLMFLWLPCFVDHDNGPAS